MNGDRFFQPGAATSQAYRNIRDLNTEPVPKAREFVEALWQRYRGYEDPHFLSDAKTHFQERFWEMYLAVAFVESGFCPSRSLGVGPEFSCVHEGQKIWFEAVVPGPGGGNDRVAHPTIGAAAYVPTEKILLRFTGALAEKRNRYLAALEKGIVSKNDAYVLAINSRGVPHAPFGNTLPFFVQAFLPIGPPTMLVDRATDKVVDSYYARRETVSKTSGTVVSTAPFLDPAFSFVSAVLHSAVDCVNRPEALGGDFIVLHNPTADRRLDQSMFRWCGRQYVFEDDELKVVSNSAA